MKVAWFDTDSKERQYLQSKDHGLDITFFEESLNQDTVGKAKGFDAVSVFVSSTLDNEVLEKIEADLVACRSTGYDHINLEKASEKRIDVCNVPEYGSDTVAEHTFGLIIALSRKIYSAIRKVEEGSFSHSGLRGFDLKGKKLGIIGTGSIGKKVIKIAKGFEMDVIAYDPFPDRDAEKELGFMYVTIDDLLKKSDIISLHCPLTGNNHHLLSNEEFEEMSETVLVNTARGELVDTEALLTALEEDWVKAAGLDVLEEECYIEDDVEYLSNLEECSTETVLKGHMLLDREDVLITPHNAFNSVEALERITEQTLENIEERKNVVSS